MFSLRDEKSITMSSWNASDCVQKQKRALYNASVLGIHQMRRGLSVSFSLSISVQQKSWCHTRTSAKLLKGNWHLIVTEDVSNK